MESFVDTEESDTFDLSLQGGVTLLQAAVLTHL